MTKNPDDIQLSEDTQVLFTDLRATLQGKEPRAEAPTEALPIDADPAPTAVLPADDLDTPSEPAEATESGPEPTGPETEEHYDVRGNPAADGSPFDWRSAKNPPAPPTPSGRTSEGGEHPQPPRPPQSAGPVPVGAPRGPVPPAPQTWANPQLQRWPIRVGLLVWAGILVILALLIIFRLFLPLDNGPLLMAVLMAAFGIVLIISGMSAGNRRKKETPPPR